MGTHNNTSLHSACGIGAANTLFLAKKELLDSVVASRGCFYLFIYILKLRWLMDNHAGDGQSLRFIMKISREETFLPTYPFLFSDSDECIHY